MANVHLNSALGALSGTVDGYVYRHYRGKTILQRKPTFTKPWSAEQAITRMNFGGASEFAATIKADPALRELYRLRGKRPKLNYRQMAMRDYFHPPEVVGLTTTGYTKQAGGELAAQAKDDFEVVRVTIAVLDADRAELAGGEAKLSNGLWRVTVPPSPATKPAVSVVVTAYDRPGHPTPRQFPLP